MTSSQDQKLQTVINKKVKLLCHLAADNQQKKDYLNHVNTNNLRLKNYIDKIESSTTYKVWLNINVILHKSTNWFKNKKIEYEFSKWKKTRKTNTFDVLIFAVIKYNFRFQRPQQLAFELVKRGHRVFYIEPDFEYASSENTTLEPTVKKIQPNLYKVKLTSRSKSTMKFFVYYNRITPEDQRALVNSIRFLTDKASITRAIIKVDNPSWTFIVDKLHLPIIYDCIDDHEAIESNPAHIGDSEKSIIQKSDAIIAASRGLAKKLINKYKPNNLTVIGNAGEYSHFSKASRKNLPVPKDMKSIKIPILGYCGAISEWFDIHLLETIAKTFPDCSIVLIGNTENPKVRETAQKYPNIFLLGEKLYRLLPEYYQLFNVCLIPFIVNHKVPRTLNPVKIYEYLATGKPIVTTYIPDLKQYGNSIYVSQDENEFCQNIKKAITEKNQQLVLKRQQFSKDNTWEKRAIQLESVMKQVLEHNL